jgi:hypothetical protein
VRVAVQPSFVFSIREFKRKENFFLEYVSDVHFKIPMMENIIMTIEGELPQCVLQSSGSLMIHCLSNSVKRSTVRSNINLNPEELSDSVNSIT